MNARHVYIDTFEHEVFDNDGIAQVLRVMHLRSGDSETQWSQSLLPTLLLRLVPIVEPLIDDLVKVHHCLVAFKDLYLHSSNI